jgi:hypothetical protein
MRFPGDRLWLLPLTAVVAGAAYEAAVALGVLNVGPRPGAEPLGRTVIFTIAEFALVGAALAGAACAAVGASLLMRTRPRFGRALMSAILIVVATVASAAGAGH